MEDYPPTNCPPVKGFELSRSSSEHGVHRMKFRVPWRLVACKSRLMRGILPYFSNFCAPIVLP